MRARRLKSALIGLAGALVAAGAAQAQPPMWVVKDADSEMVLFGSVHILPHGLDWTPPALDRALMAANDIWFELPIDAQSEAVTAALATKAGVLPPDQSLFKLLPPKDAELMSKVLPGDPLAGLLPENAQPADREALAKQLGLDQPLPVRYVTWLGDLARGDGNAPTEPSLALQHR